MTEQQDRGRRGGSAMSIDSASGRLSSASNDDHSQLIVSDDVMMHLTTLKRMLKRRLKKILIHKKDCGRQIQQQLLARQCRRTWIWFRLWFPVRHALRLSTR